MTIRKRTLRNATARAVIESHHATRLEEWGAPDAREALRRAALIIAAQEAHDRDMRTLRIQQALEIKRRKQAHEFYAGTRPYGWRSVGHGKLEPVPAEQLVIDWMLRQRGLGYGWKNITERLNEAGTPAPKGGARWNMSSVRRIAERGRDWRPPDAVAERANAAHLATIPDPAGDANR